MRSGFQLIQGVKGAHFGCHQLKTCNLNLKFQVHIFEDSQSHAAHCMCMGHVGDQCVFNIDGDVMSVTKVESTVPDRHMHTTREFDANTPGRAVAMAKSH